jgi:hypothetical protein
MEKTSYGRNLDGFKEEKPETDGFEGNRSMGQFHQLLSRIN